MASFRSAIAWIMGVGVLPVLVLGADAAKIEWRPQVTEAWQCAQAEGRPLLLYVSMEGCTFCRQMERETLNHPQVAAHVAQGFVATKIDGTKEAGLAKRLGVRVYPTTVIISPENKVLDSISGFVTADQLVSRLTSCTAARTAMKD